MIASAVVVAAPSAGLATEGQAKDYQCYVYKRVPRTHTVGWFVGVDAPRSVPTGLDEVGIFNKSLIIIRLCDACGRSNERPYGLDDGRMWGWCEGWCEAGTRHGHYN